MKIKDKDNKKAMPEQHIVNECKKFWDLSKTHYSRDVKKLQLLDATDNGDMWKALHAKFPSFQILPNSNFVSYLKENILASLYTTTKSAEVVFTSEMDKELCQYINIALEHTWDTEDVGYYQFIAGERAALCNLGITQVGWSDTTRGSEGNRIKGKVSYKNIDPMKFRRDPFATDLDSSKWCCTFEQYNKYVFESNPEYRDKFKEYMAHSTGSTETMPNYGSGPDRSSAQDNYTLFIYWIKDKDGKINEYHIVNNECLLYKKEDIKPSMFPFALLYCNPPSTGLIGVSEPAKAFANTVAYNMLRSVALTAEYKNQRPPKFINKQSGLNVQSFSKHGDEADRTFIVNGDATKAVHYHQFPNVSSTLPTQLVSLAYDIQDLSGINGRYTGRDTGSIITTGGTEEMLNRVTLIDTPKIVLYEHYAKDLTKLTLMNMIEFSPKRKYFVKNKQNPKEYDSVEVDFPKIDAETLFEYTIQISSELPKNKQRLMAWANTMMEKQMQYSQAGQQVDLMTAEEWLQYQDVPYKEQMLERMGFQRQSDVLEETAQAIYEYGQMVDSGMNPEDALMSSAQGVMNRRQGEETPLEQNTTETPQKSLSPDNLL